MYDRLVTENNHLDGRPSCTPSQWNECFKIYHLTEKMRTQEDPYISDLSDRVGRGKLIREDINNLNTGVTSCSSEDNNKNLTLNQLSIIVTTNIKKDLVYHEKLQLLLPDEKEYNCNGTDWSITCLPLKIHYQAP